MAEPSDSHVYAWMSFYPDTIKFYLESVTFYARLLKSDIEALNADPDINTILSKETLESLPVHHEIQRTERVRRWLENHSKSAEKNDSFSIEIELTHGTVRFLKSTAQLYLQQLKQRRNSIASRPNISRYALEALDTRISELEEKTRIGVFADATPMPLLVDQTVVPEQSLSAETTSPALAGVSRPRPVLMSSIELFDSELRARCLDLFESFRSDGNTDRLDTVLSEASRILENRIRSVAGLPADCVGLELASRAFGGASPILRVSNVTAEQEAAHLLFRGVFGFIRNHVQHQLVGGLLPERVLQVLGLIDYLLFLVEGAVRATPVSNTMR
jgi:Protein of unknown function (Hypoth_ymh)